MHTRGRRRLEALEARLEARASPGKRLPWRTPEQEASREQQFRRLYMQIGGEWPPSQRNPAEVREEIFALVEKDRENKREDGRWIQERTT